MELSITREEGPEAVTLVLEGSIDLISRQSLHEAGIAEINAGRSLLLDMMGVEFIDSTGIGTLVELQVAARNAGVGVAISRRSARVDRILEITGLADGWVTV